MRRLRRQAPWAPPLEQLDVVSFREETSTVVVMVCPSGQESTSVVRVYDYLPLLLWEMLAGARRALLVNRHGLRRGLSSALAADDISSLKPSEIALRMVASPVASNEGVGIVEAVGSQAAEVFAKEDLAYSAAVGELKSLAKIEASRAVKLPAGVPAEVGAFFASACTAYRILATTTAGDVVVHLGGQTAVGQCLAQLAAARGVQLVSLVSADVPAADDAVDLLKNLGAFAAAPAAYALDAAFRKLIRDLGAPRLLVVDVSRSDVAAVNTILDAAKLSYSKAKAALEEAHAYDKLEAKLVYTLTETIAAEGYHLVTHGARSGQPTLLNATNFARDDWLKTEDLPTVVDNVATAAADDQLKVWVEAYTTDTCVAARLLV